MKAFLLALVLLCFPRVYGEEEWDITGDQAAQDVIVLPTLDDQLSDHALATLDIGVAVTVLHGLYSPEDCEEIIAFLSRFLDGTEAGPPSPAEISALRGKWIERLNRVK